MLVDTHVHVVASDHLRYPLSPQDGRMGAWVEQMPVTAEQLLKRMDEAGVDRAVLVQASSAYGFENAYTADSARDYAHRFVSACIIEMTARDAPEKLSYWVTERGMRGVRIFTTPDPDASWLDDPRTFPVWDRARSLGIPVCVQTNARHLSRLRKVLEGYPDLPVALDHLGNPQQERGAEGSLPEALLALSELPKVYLKFSTVNMYAAQRAGLSVAAYFEPLLARFGARRLMWGSNYSATYDRPYGEMVKLAQRELGFLSTKDQERVLGGTALSLWPVLKGPRS